MSRCSAPIASSVRLVLQLISAVIRSSPTSAMSPSRPVLNVTEDVGRAKYQAVGLAVLTLGAVQHIGAVAFAQNRLRLLQLPHELHTLGAAAFSDNAIRALEVPPLLQKLRAYAFARNELELVSFSEGVHTIEDGVFQTNRLQTVRLPETLRTIGAYAFADNVIEYISFPESVTAIGPGAFEGNRIEYVKLPPRLEEITDWSFANNPMKEIAMPDSVVRIGHGAFRCSFRSSQSTGRGIVLPPRLREIGQGAFQNCLPIGPITIPPSVHTIGAFAFVGARAHLPDISGAKRIETRAFYQYRGSSIYPNLSPPVLNLSAAEFIGDEAFFQTMGVNSLLFGNSLRHIGDRAFMLLGYEVSLLILPGSLEHIGAGAFATSGIRGDLVLPAKIRHVGDDAFEGAQLSSLFFPASLKHVRAAALPSNGQSFVATTTEIEGDIGHKRVSRYVPQP